MVKRPQVAAYLLNHALPAMPREKDTKETNPAIHRSSQEFWCALSSALRATLPLPSVIPFCAPGLASGSLACDGSQGGVFLLEIASFRTPLFS